MSIRLSKLAGEIKSRAATEAIAKMLVGGKMLMYGDQTRPDSIEGKYEGVLLAEIPFEGAKVLSADKFKAICTQKVQAQASGLASYFVCLTKEGKVVLDGTIGTGHLEKMEHELAADMEIEKLQVWRGMEMNVEDFEYTIRWA